MIDSPNDLDEYEQEGDVVAQVTDGQFYQALASEQRRQLLHYLLEQQESTVDELATVLSGWQATTTDSIQSDSDRQKLKTALTHHHLPVLSEAGLVEYHADHETVRLESLDSLVKDIIRVSFDEGQLERL